MTFVNAYTAFKYFVGGKHETFLSFVNELCHDAMHNQVDAINSGSPPTAEHGASAAGATAAALSGDLRPGAPSPFKSPTRAAAQHKLVAFKLLADYEGGRQQRCSVCRTARTLCCAHCSSAAKCFVLCGNSCLTDHKADTTSSAHCYRRPTGVKRVRAEELSTPNAAPTSRSGARANFDPRAFAHKRTHVEGE